LSGNFPILFEGIHTTACANEPSLREHFKGVRVHNVEHDYYKQLARRESGAGRRIYFRAEAAMLASYERRLHAIQGFYALSDTDSDWYREQYPKVIHKFIPPFHADDAVHIRTGTGEYCLYHGNLAHPENEDAVNFLLREVVPHSVMPVVIAGRNPSAALRAKCLQARQCRLVENPEETELEALIEEAHIQLMPTFQRSGVKLKLIRSLFRGRHIVATDNMLYGTRMDKSAVERANTGPEFVAAIKRLSGISFGLGDIKNREQRVGIFSNTRNAQLLTDNIP
jgi:hypothetical protein